MQISNKLSLNKSEDDIRQSSLNVYENNDNFDQEDAKKHVQSQQDRNRYGVS